MGARRLVTAPSDQGNLRQICSCNYINAFLYTCSALSVMCGSLLV